MPEPTTEQQKPVPDQSEPVRSTAILGRALLGHYGIPVLVETEDGKWGSGFVRPVPRAEAIERFAAREVLLVSPAAGRVLEAARRWRAELATQVDVETGSSEDLDDAAETLAAAVDAVVGDRPTEGCGKAHCGTCPPATAEGAQETLRRLVHASIAHWTRADRSHVEAATTAVLGVVGLWERGDIPSEPECCTRRDGYECDVHPAAPVPPMPSAVAADLTAPERGVGHCVTCQGPIVNHGGDRWSHLADGYDDHTGPHPARPAVPVPEPDSGRPRWAGQVALIDASGDLWWRDQNRDDVWLRGDSDEDEGRPRSEVEETFGPTQEVVLAMPTEVDALLTDRDRQEEQRIKLVAAGHNLIDQRDAARAETTGVREELTRMAGDVDDLRGTLAMRDGQLREVTAERDRLRALVGEEGQQGWDGVPRAGAIRQAEEKHALSQQLFAVLESVKEQLATARRDAAAALAVIGELVELKDGPRGDEYERRKPQAWEQARALVAAIPASEPAQGGGGDE